ncbi:MAG: acetyl-CoA carboxylase biotin carboxyl carrier protein [Lewinellaceae bacterium]|nr:acetyl-CoA carboxylase biotin carboxyl carrier protein [Lewinellaceae bacterium]
MDFNQVQELIRLVSKQKLSEFILKDGEFKLIIRNQTGSDSPVTQVMMAPAQPMVAMTPAAAPATVGERPSAPAPAAVPAAEDSSANLIAIKSPMVGTFYRSASPDKPAFVKIGDTVEAGSPVCIIEAMKLFNEIESDIKGKIVKVLVEDAAPVEYDQPLFLVDPS